MPTPAQSSLVDPLPVHKRLPRWTVRINQTINYNKGNVGEKIKYTIDLTGEGFGQMNGADSDLSMCAKLLKCKNEIALLSKSHFAAAKNYSNVNDELKALRRLKNRRVRELNQKVRKLNQKVWKLNQKVWKLNQKVWTLHRRNIQLAQDKEQLAQDKEQLVQDKKQLAQDKEQLVQDKKQLAQDKEQLIQDKKQLAQDKEQLIQDKKQLAQDKEQPVKPHALALAESWSLQNLQKNVLLLMEKVKLDESGKDEEIRQRGGDAEELKETIQGINNVGQLVLEIGKQQSQAIGAMTEGFRKMNREQDNYIYPFYTPTRPNDGSLPVIPDLDLSAPPAFCATNQQQMPVLSSSPDNVNFGPSYNGRFAYPVSSPQTPMLSPRSPGRGGSSLQVPSLQGYQDASWPGSSNY
ncbi:hypothetical protein NHJ13734_007495 [Beauveria thailandica]